MYVVVIFVSLFDHFCQALKAAASGAQSVFTALRRQLDCWKSAGAKLAFWLAGQLDDGVDCKDVSGESHRQLRDIVVDRLDQECLGDRANTHPR